VDTLLSIITMYRYDPSLFDDMVIPPELDKELLTDNIMLELGELELLYNDPNIMKFAIGRWSAKELKKWQDLYKTTTLEYNPIENYNRTEEFTDAETRALSKNNTQTRDLATTGNETRDLAGTNNETRTLAGTNNETRDLETGIVGITDTTDNDAQGGTNSTKREVSAYNTTALATDSIETQTLGATNAKTVHTETTQTGADTGTVNTATTDTGTVNTATTDTGAVGTATTDTGTVTDAATDTGTVEITKTGNAKGNIGVTTTQQMIEAERDVVKFNIYDYILQSFKARFCILVY
jgi:hypothetical protein